MYNEYKFQFFDLFILQCELNLFIINFFGTNSSLNFLTFSITHESYKYSKNENVETVFTGEECFCRDWHGCIMAQSIVGLENVQPYKFSECSKKDYIDQLRTGHGLCLLNKPNEVSTFLFLVVVFSCSFFFFYSGK